jgi:hypothetical protein
MYSFFFINVDLMKAYSGRNLVPTFEITKQTDSCDRRTAQTLFQFNIETLFNLLVTRCINKFNFQQLYVLPTLYLCVV